MALVNCEKCGANISEKALSCPRCGSTEPHTKEGLSCSECGFKVPGDLSLESCPECGNPDIAAERSQAEKTREVQGEAHSDLPQEPLPDQPDLLKSLSVWDSLLNIRSFWRTKKAVSSGRKLYDYSAVDLKKEGLMEPWIFNISESVLATIPALVAMAMMKFLYPSPQVDPLDQRISSAVFPFLVPVTLVITARLFAWSSLKKTDSTPEKKRRALLAYLYLNGAHGLAPQALFVFGITVGVAYMQPHVPSNPLVSIALLVATLVGMWWEAHLAGKSIPRRLFELNGYSSEVPRLWKRRQENHGPWSRYTIALVLLVPTAMLIFLFTITALSQLVTVSLEALRTNLVG